MKVRSSKERKDRVHLSIWDRRGRTKEQGNDSQLCPEAYVCSVVPTTCTQLSNNKTCWKHSVPSHPTQIKKPCWSHTPHKSIHQAVVMTMSEAAAGELDDRCLWQMVPSAWMSDVELPLYCTDLFYPPYQSPLSHSPTDTVTLPQEEKKKNTVSPKTSALHRRLVCFLIKADQWDRWANVLINRSEIRQWEIR